MTDQNQAPFELRLSVKTRAETLACPLSIARAARAMGLDDHHVRRLELIASELATNLVRHAGGGTLTLRRTDSPAAGVLLTAQDNGPGFSDIEAALTDGVSEGRILTEEVPPIHRIGLGSGLGAVGRLADFMEIANLAEGGAQVSAFVSEVASRR